MTMASIVFVWENFGPIHSDRCDAVASRVGGGRKVIGLELGGNSQVYEWNSESGTKFEKKTLFHGKKIDEVSFLRKFYTLARTCFALRRADFFFCHYESPSIFLTAALLRLTGSRVFVMNDSKYDDYRRYVGRELIKKIFYLPYTGAVASGTRAADYFRFLGLPEKRIVLNYDTLSTDRIRRLSGVDRAPDGPPFAARHFTIVSRMVPKKNLSMALNAYALYRAGAAHPRQLHICGSGPLDAELRDEAARLGLSDSVIFRGFLQIDEVCPILGKTLALILPSTQEQFGNVVIEAQAMGLPVIVSENCGARDLLVRSGVNGFVIEPDNPEGLAYFMGLIDSDEALWRRMAIATAPFSTLGDASRFAQAIVDLTGDFAEGLAPINEPPKTSIADRL
ncbi:glycosyl transferase group 1 [Methylocella silvestris BL2]|uniref:Glycosyl transferase group 1 n=1 Tax=Methylocella silvestris (strain DSM 15510 / CIP 108128 / LMG 27833 / NCIMB 13906 / BL2) TaxID=395965 RepID=B8ET78_METSB|nr:glycosyltransferase [Methylocella silvestris]ACK51720.1 glycosyl transferase group 1 [Methylocella silvestris BL2]